MLNFHSKAVELPIHRQRKTNAEICRVIAALHQRQKQYNLDEDGDELPHGAMTDVANEFKTARSNVSKWWAKRHDLSSANSNSKKSKKWEAGSKAPYKEQEALVYVSLYIRRQIDGLWVDRYWIMDEMLKVVADTQPAGWEDFAASSGWLAGFCKRWDVCSQRRTNKSNIPLHDKVD